MFKNRDQLVQNYKLLGGGNRQFYFWGVASFSFSKIWGIASFWLLFAPKNLGITPKNLHTEPKNLGEEEKILADLSKILDSEAKILGIASFLLPS